MKWLRRAVGLAVLLVVGAALASGGSGADSVRQRYLPDANALRTVSRFGGERIVSVASLGNPEVVRPILAGLRRPGRWEPGRHRGRGDVFAIAARPARSSPPTHGRGRCRWARGWAYVWPRDASAVAIALASAGYRVEAKRIVAFLRGLDLGAGPDSRPTAPRSTGAAPRGTRPDGSPRPPGSSDCRCNSGSRLGKDSPTTRRTAPATSSPTRSRRESPEIRALFGTPAGALARRAGDPASGLDSAAAWAVHPFPHPALYPLVRRTLLRLAAASGRFGIVPEDWDGGDDPWTAPTAWTAWSLAALGERHAALHLWPSCTALRPRRDAPRAGRRPHRHPDLDHAAGLVPRLRDPRPAPTLAELEQLERQLDLLPRGPTQPGRRPERPPSACGRS